jgi:hypothetical protein
VAVSRVGKRPQAVRVAIRKLADAKVNRVNRAASEVIKVVSKGAVRKAVGRATANRDRKVVR